MKRCLWLGLSLTLLASLVSCGTTPTEVTGGVEYFPHEDGYSWTYDYLISTTTEAITQRNTFSGTTTVDSTTVQKLKGEIIRTTHTITRETLYKATDADVRGYGFIDNPTTEAYVLLSFPLRVGNGWVVTGTVEATVAAKESVTVPAGTFSCFKIDYAGSSPSSSWYGENIGLVKSVITSLSGTVEVTTTVELVSKNF